MANPMNWKNITVSITKLANDIKNKQLKISDTTHQLRDVGRLLAWLGSCLGRTQSARWRENTGRARPTNHIAAQPYLLLIDQSHASFKNWFAWPAWRVFTPDRGCKTMCSYPVFFGNNHVSQKQMLQLPLRDEVPSFIANYEKLNGNMFEASLCLFSGCLDVWKNKIGSKERILAWESREGALRNGELWEDALWEGLRKFSVATGHLTLTWFNLGSRVHLSLTFQQLRFDGGG